jgi:hypothetical protein
MLAIAYMGLEWSDLDHVPQAVRIVVSRVRHPVGASVVPDTETYSTSFGPMATLPGSVAVSWLAIRACSAWAAGVGAVRNSAHGPRRADVRIGGMR